MNKIFLTLFLIIATNYSKAQGFLYQKPDYQLNDNYWVYVSNVQILPDTNNKYDFQFIASNKSNAYFLPKDSIQFTNPKVIAYWVKFKLKKVIDTTLIIRFNPVYSLVQYYRPINNKYIIEQAGFKLSSKLEKNNKIPEIFFQLSNSDTSTWHYFKIESPNAILGLGFYVNPVSYLFDFLPQNFFKSGIFFGLIAFAFIFNIILFYQLRQLSYLFYSLYVFMFGIYVTAEFSFFSIFQFGHYRFTFWIYTIPFVLMTIFLLLYIYSFFPTGNQFNKVKKIALAMIFIRIILFIGAYIFDSNTFLFSLVVDMLCIMLPFMFIIYHSINYKPSRYLAIAIGLIFFGYAAHFKLINYNAFLIDTFTIQNLGILEILMLSLALGSRIKTIELEKQYNIDMLLIELKEKQLLKDRINIELEEKVAERTLEINRMNNVLKEHNLHLEIEVGNLVTARVMQEAVGIEEFKKIFLTEDLCYSYLADLKWKNGFVCKFCNSTRYTLINKPFVHSRRCVDCKKVESPTANTIFHKLKFPIQKAFYILFLVTSKQKITYEQLSQEVDLRVATCFAFKKKIIEVMEIKKISKKGKVTWSDWILP